MTSTAGWAPCSDRSRERADPLAATASRGLQWFLVEVEGAWGGNAFQTSALGRELGQALVHRIEAAGMRPLAIRRVARRGAAGSRRAQTSWRWAFVDARPGFEEVRWGEVQDARDLLLVPLDGSTGIRSADPVYCVCTHAKHDQCCAVRGRPVALALAEAYPEQTWECSHLGGDRFAGTMAIFPEGHAFGRVDDADAAGLVRDYLAGRADERFYRGRTSLSHPVQAAQHFARLHFGDDRLASFAPIAEVPVPAEASLRGVPLPTAVSLPGVPLPTAVPLPGALLPAVGPGQAATPRQASPSHASGRATEVRLAATGPAHEPLVVRVVVAETLSEPLLSTCAATRFGRTREYDLVSLETLPA